MKVVFIDTVHPVLAERLTDAGFICLDVSKNSRSEVEEILVDATGIVIRSRFTMDESFLKHAPNLAFIARSGAGMENIDVNYCESRNIQLFNAPEGNRNAVGEHALGMLLSLMNKLHSADREVRNGLWRREENRGIELDGKTVAIIGYGNNGAAFAKKLRGFDVRVLAFDKYKADFSSEFVEESDMDTIYKEADVVSFHIPQNQETLFLVNDLYLSSFHKPIFLLNLSRGKIVQTSSLVNGLKTGKIYGAGLDVLEYEKTSFESFFENNMPDSFRELLSFENVILSPHVGGWTHESYFLLSNVLADKILNFYKK